MELNIKWAEIRKVNVLYGKFYFVADIYKKGDIKSFCIAYKASKEWKLNDLQFVPFKVTHACLIDGITHKLPLTTYDIGDRVVTSTDIKKYKVNSVGEIVGKYDKMGTWCVRMEDDFVILLEDKWIKSYYPGGENA